MRPKLTAGLQQSRRGEAVLNKSWLTRPRWAPQPGVVRVFIVGIVFLIAALIACPTLFTVAWHLRHGHTIECRGKSIFVPFRWTAEIDDGNDALLTKLPIFVPLRPGTPAIESSITIGASPVREASRKEELYTTFKNLFWNMHPDFGEAVSGPFKAGSGPHESFCMEGTNAGQARSSVSCLILGATWRADFMGRTGDMKDFFAIIRELN